MGEWEGGSDTIKLGEEGGVVRGVGKRLTEAPSDDFHFQMKQYKSMIFVIVLSFVSVPVYPFIRIYLSIRKT